MIETSVDYFRSDVPSGRSGPWVIEKVALPEREYDANSDPRATCFKYRPGTYTCLRRGHEQFMTDLYDEWWTQTSALKQASARGGEVLITGLGLGLIAEAILRRAAHRVRRVTIIEYAADVIHLVAPYLMTRYPGKIEVLEGDAFAWAPADARRFSVGWHDIWSNPAAPGVGEDMERLRTHHAKWCDWQGFWPDSYQRAERETTA